MSERILKALMQLFAIIAKVESTTNDGRAVVKSFLKGQLNLELVDEYLKLYDEFIEINHNTSSKKEGAKKRTSLNSVKVLRICTQINSELTQKQKIVVLLRLIEFIYSSEEITPQDLEFVSTVAETFNISDQEYASCNSFIQSKEQEIPDSTHVLIINNQKDTKFNNTKHIYSETLSGQLRVLWIESVNIYSLRYLGNSELYLNGQPLIKDRVYILNQGASIRSSKVQPIYYSDIISSFLSDKSTAKISFVANNIEYHFKGGKIGLQNIALQEDSGKLIGIMGGSGAGKSTLLNVLNGNEKPSKGEVLINGYNIHTEKEKIEGVIGFVSQDDLLIEELSVFQNLFYNAKLCFGSLNDSEIASRVSSILNDIGLYEAKDLKVGSPLEKTISGGQRKRLNIALELIREPSVMFVDEPTSGLSSRDSENIMDLLKELALKGKLIFVVIHQPSSEIFKMFDKLKILDLGGYPIYYGNPVEAIIYFKTLINHVNCNESECVTCGNVNPEQIFNIIESKVVDEYGNLTRNRKISPKEWNNSYLDKIAAPVSAPASKTALPAIPFKIANKLKQFRIFTKRDILSKLTNKQYLIINLLEAPILGLFLAYLTKYYNTDISNKIGYVLRENENIPAYLFMSVIVALFIGLTVSAEEIIRDRKILKRESFLNLSWGSYLFSKISIMFFLSAIQTLSFILVANFMLGIKGMNTDYWIILFTTSCFANMLGLNISSAFNSAVTIYILIPFILIPQLLLSGVIVKFDKLNPSIAAEKTVPVWGDVMASRWAFEALAVNQFKENDYEQNFYEFDKDISYADFRKNFWINELKGKIDYCQKNSNNPAMKTELENAIVLIKNELFYEDAQNKKVKFAQGIDKISLENFKNEEFVNSLKSYIHELYRNYIKLYNKASDDKDRVISKLTKTPQMKEDFIRLKNEYANDNLTDLVINRNEINKIMEKNGELIQKSDPIYLDPSGQTSISAHFFAPNKKVFGNIVDTFWVNIIVIWGMSFLLAITLYFKLFGKFLDALEELFMRFIRKKI